MYRIWNDLGTINQPKKRSAVAIGYTHYWTTSETATKKNWKEFCKQARLIIAGFDGKICGGDGNGKPEISDECIWLNGCAEDEHDHETFNITVNGGAWDFCKTARKPYDTVVVALLMVGKRMGIIKEWNSDGDEAHGDFDAATALLEKTVDKV